MMNSKFYVSNCPLGHKSNLVNTTLKMREGFFLRLCSACGQLVSSCTKEIYDSTMKEFDVPEGTSPMGRAVSRANKLFGDRLVLVQKYLRKPVERIKLLDLGCSSGDFLEVANKMGFKAEGLEPAKQAALAAQRKGLKVHIGTIENHNFSVNSFDCITLFEVIEHVLDPVSLLKHCHNILTPGGIIMIGTGNANSLTTKIMKHRWDYFDMSKHGGHISFYNNESIKMLAELSNFKLLSIKTRSLKFFERNETSTLIYKTTKLMAQILCLPVKWFNCGHDMLAVFQK